MSDAKDDGTTVVPTIPAWLLSTAAPLDIGPVEKPTYLQGSYSGQAQTDASRQTAAISSDRKEDTVDNEEIDSEEEDALPETEEEKRTVRAIQAGFRILEMTMRDGATGKVVWTSKDLGPEILFDDVSNAASSGSGEARKNTEAHLPASILAAPSVTRSITFSSRELMRHFFMTQRVYLHGQLLEKHEFDFGFVIPNSTNSWEQEIEAADDDVGTLEPSLLSGNTTVVTKFYDKGLLIGGCTVRLFYDR